MGIINETRYAELNSTLYKLNDKKTELDEAEKIYNKNYQKLILLKRELQDTKKCLRRDKNFSPKEVEEILTYYRTTIKDLKQVCKQDKNKIIEIGSIVEKLQAKYEEMLSSFMKEFKENGYSFY